MVDNYTEMLTNIRANTKTSFGQLGKPAILQVIDTIIGTKASGASSSSQPAPAGMQVGGEGNQHKKTQEPSMYIFDLLPNGGVATLPQWSPKRGSPRQRARGIEAQILWGVVQHSTTVYYETSIA